MDNYENKQVMLGNRYELVEKIGTGGMAHVYKAKDHRLNRFVAIKILKSEYTNDEDFIKNFNNEAKSAASLTHPNIVSVYDVGHENNIYYIVMEFIDGITLKMLILQKKYIKWKDAMIITKQIISALETAHKYHIVHRDIKPHNIMLTKNGTAKVTDFGIARAVSDSTIKMDESNMCSVHYLSPEQAKGKYVDERSDLYSMGITLYEMLTGRVPFDGDSSVSVAMMHINNHIVPPIEINPNIPIGVNDFVIKATQKSPRNRYQSATEMLADITVILLSPHEHLNMSSSSANGTGKASSNKNKYDPNQTGNSKQKDKTKNRRFKLENINVANFARGTASIVISLIVSFVILAISAGVLLKRVDTLKEKEYVVENYVGENISDVEKTLKSIGINVEKVYVPSPSSESNVITAQQPDTGIIKKDETITFNVSKNDDEFIVGDYTNKDYRLIEEDFRNSGVDLKIVEQSSDTINKGDIIGTRPGVNSVLSEGDTLVIFMSKGKMYKDVTLPNLVGKLDSEAKLLLENLGLKVEILPYIKPEPVEEPSTDGDALYANNNDYNISSVDKKNNNGNNGKNNSKNLDDVIEQFTNLIGDVVLENQEGEITPTPEVTITPTPTQEPISTPTPDPNEGKYIVAQYPKEGTKIMDGDTIILYRSPVEAYRETKTITINKEDEMNISGDFYLKIETLPSDTNQKEIIFEGVKEEAELPLTFEIGIPKGGETEVNIYLNEGGSLYCKYIYESSSIKK